MGFYKELGDRLEKWLKEKIKVVDTKVESIAKYQKYVNTELDYCQLSISNTTNTYKLYENPIFNFDTLVYGNNMEYDLTNHSISLKAGKTYNITVNCMLDNNATYINYRVYNMNTDEKLLSNINIFGCIWGKEVSGTSDSDIDFIYKCDEDCEIIIKSDMPSSNTAVTLRYAVLTVQEINRQITIDPVEHVNESQGIEDTPVGHIIAHMGTLAPKHYLICDGTEYNITDYPYLAQHIEDNFGSISYFGGDGETTFRVPDLRGEFLRGTGTATRDSGSGAAVGQHQEPTQHARIRNYQNSTIAIDVGQSGWDSNYPDKTISSSVRRYKDVGMQNDNIGSGYIITSRPTNTAVLYCIKYEPTYFMVTTRTTTQEEVDAVKEQNSLLQEQITALQEQNTLLTQEITQLSEILDNLNNTEV